MPGFFVSIGEGVIGETPNEVFIAVNVPTSNVTATLYPPEILAGVAIEVPTTDVTVALVAPEIDTGVVDTVPTVNVDVELFAPQILTGVLIEVPALPVAVATLAPTNTSGTAIVLPQQFLVDIGSAGAGAVGEFVIGEGSPFSSGESVPNVNVQLLAPAVLAGAYVVIPPWADTAVQLWAPKISISANVFPPNTNTTVQLFAPTILAGAEDVVPAISVAAELFAPTIVGGARIDVPTLAVTSTVETLIIQGGAFVGIPLTPVDVFLYVPDIQAGTGIFVSQHIDTTVTLYPPQILSGWTVFPPSLNIAAALPIPEIDSRSIRTNIQIIAS